MTSGGGKGGGPKQITISKSYTISVAIGLADTRITGPMARIRRAWRDATLFFDASQGNALPSNWTFYPGDTTQDPDPVIEAVVGVGNAPAYRHCCYLVMEDEDLGASGRMFNYTFELDQNAEEETTSLATVITDVVTAVGLAGALSVDELPEGTVNIALVSVQAARASLEQLAQAYRFYVLESAGQIAFRNIGTGDVLADIPEDCLGAGEDTHATTSLDIQRTQDLDLPRTLTATYVDPAQNFQQNTQRAQFDLPLQTSEQDRNINLPMALAAAQAKQVAEELLASAWIQRETLRFTLSNLFLAFEPGDRVTLTARELTYGAVLTETSYGGPGLLECRAVPDAAFTRGVTVSSTGDVVFDHPELIPPGATTPLLLNLPALDSTDTPARYHVAYIGVTEPWEGGVLMRSIDGGSSYSQVDTSGLEAFTGTVASATASADWHFLDTATTISVVLEYGELLSVTDMALYGGANRCMVGSELLAFGVATLTAPRTYTLSRLLRGQRGTEWAVGTHGSNEVFLFLDTAVRKIPLALSDRYVSRPYKAVTTRQDIADAIAVDFLPTGANLDPWTVAQPSKTLSGTDWILTWYLRSRFTAGGLLGSGVGFDPDFVGFKVVVYSDGSYSTVVRTTMTDGGDPMAAEVLKTLTYTDAQQTADFGSPQGTVYVQIFQVAQNGISLGATAL